MKRNHIKEKATVNEGLYDRFIDGFFGALRRGVADSFQKQAEKQGLPPELLTHMQKMEKDYEQFKTAMDRLKKK